MNKCWANHIFSVVFDFISLSLCLVPSFVHIFYFLFFHFPTLFELVEKRFYFYYCRSIICRQCINIIPIVSISSIYLRRVVCPYAIFFFFFFFTILCAVVARFLCLFASRSRFVVRLTRPFWLDVDLIHCHSKRYSTPVASLLQYLPPETLYYTIRVYEYFVSFSGRAVRVFHFSHTKRQQSFRKLIYGNNSWLNFWSERFCAGAKYVYFIERRLHTDTRIYIPSLIFHAQHNLN